MQELQDIWRYADALQEAAETPPWATYGAAERGMDPLENRWYHNRTVRRAKAGQLTAQQLAQYPSNPADQTLMAMGALEPYSKSGCG